jgi:hypothetical protein
MLVSNSFLIFAYSERWVKGITIKPPTAIYGSLELPWEK